MRLGYTMLCEQTAPKQLVSDLVRAEETGFDFSVISDHYFPWLEDQGHSPYAWSVLGAAAQASSRIGLMTFVTCPTMRYHPAVVAQKAATMGLLSDGRFTLGLGAGENLNEHIVGHGWPSADVRHAMLAEAVEVIGKLFDGGYVNYSGTHITADAAKLYDLPAQRVPIAIAASGRPRPGLRPAALGRVPGPAAGGRARRRRAHRQPAGDPGGLIRRAAPSLKPSTRTALPRRPCVPDWDGWSKDRDRRWRNASP